MKGPKRQVFSHQPSQPSRRAEPCHVSSAHSPSQTVGPSCSLAHARVKSTHQSQGEWRPRARPSQLWLFSPRGSRAQSATNRRSPRVEAVGHYSSVQPEAATCLPLTPATNHKLPRGIHFPQRRIRRRHVSPMMRFKHRSTPSLPDFFPKQFIIQRAYKCKINGIKAMKVNYNLYKRQRLPREEAQCRPKGSFRSRAVFGGRVRQRERKKSEKLLRVFV